MEVTMAQQAAKIDLSVKQRRIIERLARSRTEPQRLVEQARALGIDAQRSRRWRKRFASAHEVLATTEATGDERELERKIREVLMDKHRSGTPPKFTPEQVSLMVALACHKPSELGLPLSHWTADELARQAVELGIVKSISGRHLDRFLKGG
jgi:hypothetical protein